MDFSLFTFGLRAKYIYFEISEVPLQRSHLDPVGSESRDRAPLSAYRTIDFAIVIPRPDRFVSRYVSLLIDSAIVIALPDRHTGRYGPFLIIVALAEPL